MPTKPLLVRTRIASLLFDPKTIAKVPRAVGVSRRVLVTGGSDDNLNANFLKSADIYDPATNTFSPTGDMRARQGPERPREAGEARAGS